ncbi:SH3 domain-containing protein [Deinococcus sp.]|uniref:SH3 domain-containing protein n=1 Tax=Deinococcus sp. TaxID=47478 RepID=UPI003C7C01CE
MLLTLLALPLLHLDCPALRRGAGFEMRPGIRAGLRQTDDERFTLSTGSQTLQATGNCNPEFNMNVLVADFNFDGYRDVAVPTDTGYGGVNTFYTLYFYRPASRTFQKTRYRDDQNDHAIRANLSPDPVTHTVDGSYKSGPAYVALTLCPTPDGLDLYTCRQGDLNFNLAQTADDYDWTWFSPSGTVLASRPLRRSGEDRSRWTVAAARLDLHTGPTLNSKSLAYVVRDDQVEVLELRAGWAHVRYSGQGKRVFGGWVKLAALR